MRGILFILVLVLTLSSCSKESSPVPYPQQNEPGENETVTDKIYGAWQRTDPWDTLPMYYSFEPDGSFTLTDYSKGWYLDSTSGNWLKDTTINIYEGNWDYIQYGHPEFDFYFQRNGFAPLQFKILKLSEDSLILSTESRTEWILFRYED